MTTPRPFLKFVGGKAQLLPELLKRVPKKYGRYHEPFVGGGALFFALAPKRASLGDTNERLIRTYQAVRDDIEAVISQLRYCSYEKTFYYEMRRRDIDQASDVDVAMWFIYLNKCGFNGLYRVNSKGGFNVPFGSYKNPTICDAENLRACSKALRNVDIVCQSFESGAGRYRKGDFCYFDPPYVPVSKTSGFTTYTAGGFDHERQLELALFASKLKRRGVHVLLTNSIAAKPLYKGFKIREVDARRSVNSKASARGAVKELVIT